MVKELPSDKDTEKSRRCTLNCWTSSALMMAGVSINTNARAPRRTTLRRQQSDCEYQSFIVFSFQTKVTRHEKTSHGSLINHRRISRRRTLTLNIGWEAGGSFERSIVRVVYGT